MVEYFHSKGVKVVFGDLDDKNGNDIADKLGKYDIIGIVINDSVTTYTHCEVRC
jgi:hypothetical protein